MKNVALFLCVTTFIGFTAVGLSHGQVKDAGPRIVLEEEEITVIEDGKIIRKVHVSEHGEEKREILHYVKQKVFKKLGVQSHNEISDKKLSAKFTEEWKKLISIKKVAAPKLKFLDENGNVAKEVSLASEAWKGRVKETRNNFKKGEFDAEMMTVRWPKVSKNGKYAVMDNTTFADAGHSIPLGKIVLYDVKGNILFEKQLPLGMAVYGDQLGHMVVSDSGTVAFVAGDFEEIPGSIKLYVYDKAGKELLAYPREDENAMPGNVLGISNNGKFIAAKVNFNHRSTRTVFIDVERNKRWKADRSYVVYEISDAGFIRADYYDETRGERSTELVIDLETMWLQ